MITMPGLTEREPSADESPVGPGLPLPPAPPQERPFWVLLLSFTVLVLVIVAAGVLAHRRAESAAKAEVQTVLSAVTSIKIAQIESWRAELHDRALTLATDPAFARDVDALERSARRETPRLRDIAFRLQALLRTRQFSAVTVFDRRGRVIDSAGDAVIPADAPPDDGYSEDPVQWQDLQIFGDAGAIRMALHVCIGQNGSDPAAACPSLRLEVDPSQYLYPIVQANPTGSATAETFLFRTEDERIVYLNALKHRPGPPLALHVDANRPELLAAQVMKGYEGMLEGEDYRRVRVVGYGRKVPASPWSLVSKVDAAEVYAPLVRQTRTILVATLSAVLLCGLTVGSWWRQQRTRVALERLRAEEARRALARHYGSLTRTSNDVILLADGERRIVEINERAAAQYGVPPDDLVGMRLRDLCSLDAVEAHELDWMRCGERGLLFETEHRRADGTVFPVEISGRALTDAQGVWYQAVIRDISDRRRLESRMRLYSMVFETTGDAVLITDERQRIIAVNPAFLEITGYTLDEVIGQTPRLLSSGRQDREFYSRMWTAIARTGHWQGEIWNRRKDGSVYPEWQHISVVQDLAGRVTHYVAIFSDISERKATEERINHLAQHDPLTDLPNRFLMQERLEDAIVVARQQKHRVGVMLIDLDRFKNINDSLGHPVGDRLLQGVASRLAHALRRNDTVCRLGGDEFVVIVPDVKDTNYLGAVADRLLDALAEDFHLDDHDIHVTTSIGVSVYPDDGEDMDVLIRNADTAMYQAKEKGRNGYQFFTADMNERALERLTLESELRAGLSRREFVLHYQLQCSMATGRVVGVEALVRWNSPKLGLVPPARFISVAEESGLIIPLGEYLLTQACRQRRIWLDQGLTDFPVSVNVSPLQFRDDNFDQRVANVLLETRLPARLLDLELTESAVMHRGVETVQMLERLKALGVTLSIDDFGTGYSSLGYLKSFPIDRLKIDRSFVRDLLEDANDVAIVRAIVALGHTLELRVIAEGVETAEQCALLRNTGCDECQGFLLGMPMEAHLVPRACVTARDRLFHDAAADEVA
ncbi:MAG: EAL domain-containing protein [Betaproteobacteria bacterium]|nr:EAL domain-containing protein [Betaproteobacteria bacterium]